MMKSEFKKYRRTNIAEMRPARPEDFAVYNNISVSKEDTQEVANLMTGKILSAGMIARNPKNHKDEWYVAKQYVIDNFKRIA